MVCITLKDDEDVESPSASVCDDGISFAYVIVERRRDVDDMSVSGMDA